MPRTRRVPWPRPPASGACGCTTCRDGRRRAGRGGLVGGRPMSGLDRVELRGLRATGRHGVLAHETALGPAVRGRRDAAPGHERGGGERRPGADRRLRHAGRAGGRGRRRGAGAADRDPGPADRRRGPSAGPGPGRRRQRPQARGADHGAVRRRRRHHPPRAASDRPDVLCGNRFRRPGPGREPRGPGVHPGRRRRRAGRCRRPRPSSPCPRWPAPSRSAARSSRRTSMLWSWPAPNLTPAVGPGRRAPRRAGAPAASGWCAGGRGRSTST